MPYIKQEDRLRIAGGGYVTCAGELQYVFAGIINNYLERIKVTKGQWRYQDLNDIVGALEGAKLEFYRRVAAPYEDQKKHDNGDVYE